MSDIPEGQDGHEARAMRAVLDSQRADFLRAGPPSARQRREWLSTAIGLLVDHKADFAAAMSTDFGHRSTEQSLITDIYASVESLKFARANVARWMRPERRSPTFPLGFLGARAELRTQPKGVMGLISPWNFPVNLTFGPLASMLAAGNRIMIKPSELTPETSRLMADLLHGAFDRNVIAVIQGGPEVGRTFSELPFDHLMFTGSTAVGRHVMRAAADNLVPLTLELGGKCPAVIGTGADLTQAAQRIVTGKMLNAGQVCLSPDYVLLREDQVDPFVKAVETAMATQYPTLLNNPDYTSVQNDTHFERLIAHLEDAIRKGARIIEVNPADESFGEQPLRKMPLMLVVNPSPDMTVMRDELFGPVLPLVTVSAIEDAVAHVNAHNRPLALYYFGSNAKEREFVLSHTVSGGVTVNDVIMHVSIEDLPFGGVGPSGMGRYHGHEGYKEFSHQRAVYMQSWADPSRLFRPPYSEKIRTFMRLMIKK